MVYETLLLFGAIGLIAMAALGFAHGGAGAARFGGSRGIGHGVHTHGSLGSARGPAGTTLQAHGHVHANAHGHGHVHVHLNSSSVLREVGALFLGLLSPVTVFSLCIGAGAVGMAATAMHERPVVTLIAAILGGFLLFGLFVRPVMNLIMGFASKPAETLTGAVAGEAIATGRFDARGRGVVRLTVDGQLVRVLAHLETGDREGSSRIRSGDKLLVVSVDKKSNSCVVTPLT